MTLLPHPPLPRRAGFTLIELMVVIAIIIVLVGLLLVGINYAYVRARVTGAATDVQQMDASMKAFKAKYGIYPPDQFYLNTKWSNYNPANALHARSLRVINTLWPGIGTGWSIDWAGNGMPVDETLDGDQCLVFFLGGIPSPTGGTPPFAPPLGFSVNPQNPAMVANPAANVGKLGPFFAFPPGQLYLRQGNNFASFKDYYNQQPYLYFSSNNVKNGYNAYYPTNPAPPYTYGITLTNLNGNLVTVQAYYQTAPTVSAGAQVSRGVFLNPDTCQIICAGLDGNFGAGAGPWTPTNAETFYPSGSDGADDQANFYSASLGVSQ
jgi:prepilin-type N-terminal cleavage/methylation domain-containing protein